MLRAAIVFAVAAAWGGPEIRVREGEWGGASTADIRKVLESAAAALVPHFPGREFPVIEVSRGRESPITLYQRGPKGEIRVRLNVEETRWAQFAFQFAHELGHILCRYEDHSEKEVKWLEETLCEVASLYALRRMAEAWKERPPYPNWRDYAPHLAEYAAERLKKHALDKGATLADWFRKNEPGMRANAELRDKNTVVAAALLPLFEKEPERWEAVGSLPRGSPKEPRTTREYLRDWRAAAPEKHRGFIAKIATALGTPLD